MIQEMNLKTAAARLDAEYTGGDCLFKQVRIDSRAVEPGDLFVAIKGERFDAHDFLADVAERGASGFVLERENTDIKLPQMKVADSVKALGQLAALARDDFAGKMLAITGSSGKTTVKGMSASILAQKGKTHATAGNLNNHIGVPLTLFSMPVDCEFAVIEMGASGPGEIAYLSAIARPDVAMINNVMAAHVEGFGSLQGVSRAKAEIYEALSEDAIAVVNRDDAFADEWLEKLSAKRVLTFSLCDNDADFYADGVTASAGKIKFTLHSPAGSADVAMRLIGLHNVANALAACAGCYALGADLNALVAGLEAYSPINGRMKIRTGICATTLIDDSYNANPGAVKAAIDALVAQPGRSILVLGDMGELGEDSIELHKDVGRYAKQAGVDMLLTVGSLSAETAQAFGAGDTHFTNHQGAIDCLRARLSEGDVILIKGSRSARMEVVVNAISASGEQN